MSTYSYVCDACGVSEEVQHGMSEQPSLLCPQGHVMRKDVGASFPHISLQWHKGQGIGDRLVINAARRKGTDGHSAVASRARS